VTTSTATSLTATSNPSLLDELTARQREAVTHAAGPLLIIAGAGTGKTTVITRRIAWLLIHGQVRADQILALTFSEKAARQMQERVDLLVPYGLVDVAIRTFHAFGDQLIREHALSLGVSPNARVLSQAEQHVFLREHVFELPLERYRPLTDPTRYLSALSSVFARAKDELATAEDMLAFAESELAKLKESKVAPDAESASQLEKLARTREAALAYGAYQKLLRQADALDFGDQISLAVTLLESQPEVLSSMRKRFRYILVDEFQDTNFAQFRLLQLLAQKGAHVTVVADDDQSIYKWRGAAISNVLKFLEHYADARSVVLTENFRSTQEILDRSYRLIRFNDPDRLEVKQGIDKRLVAMRAKDSPEESVQFHSFDTASSEADWVARTIRELISSGARRPSEIAILVRGNREADLFLRAMNVLGVPWQFSGSSGLFARGESKMLVSCLRALADPEDSMSWFHVASSRLYAAPMEDLVASMAHAKRTNQSLKSVLVKMQRGELPELSFSDAGRACLESLLSDIGRLLEMARSRSAGQVLYQWLSDRGILAALSRVDSLEEASQLQTVGQFFDQLRRLEELVGGELLTVVQHLELFEAMGNEPVELDDAWADRVNVLTVHKAKGLEFGIVFMVGLIQGRFPGARRSDPIELPEPLIKDILPTGDYHLQEERRLFYVGMTRAKETLHLTAASHYGGKTLRKVSQFVLEAMDIPSSAVKPRQVQARDLIERSALQTPLPVLPRKTPPGPLRLDPHGADDYLTCPLKYRYSHILRVPVMRHHRVIYGSAVHKAVEEYFKRTLRGDPVSEADLHAVLENNWSSEGFLTREHESLRLAQARGALSRFYANQQAHPEKPSLIEERFKFALEPDILVSGRWDRVDGAGSDAVMIDYKTSDIRQQAQADKRARESFQLLIYALAWQRLFGVLPAESQLRFLETGLIGTVVFDPDDMERAQELLLTVAQGIRENNFQAKPNEKECQRCAFAAICPSAYPSR